MQTRLYMLSCGMAITATASLKGFNTLDVWRKLHPNFQNCHIGQTCFSESAPKSQTFDAKAHKFTELKVPVADCIVQFLRDEYTVEALEENGTVRGFVTDAISAETTEYYLDKTQDLMVKNEKGNLVPASGDYQALSLVSRMMLRLHK